MRVNLPALCSFLGTFVPVGLVPLRALFAKFSIDEVFPGLSFSECSALFIGLVRPIHLGEQLHVNRLDDANICHQASDCAGSICTTGKPEAEDLIARLIIQHDEIIRLDDILSQTGANATLSTTLRLRQVTGSNTTIVVNKLMKLLGWIVLVSANTGDMSAELGNIGWYIISTRYRTLPCS